MNGVWGMAWLLRLIRHGYAIRIENDVKGKDHALLDRSITDHYVGRCVVGIWRAGYRDDGHIEGAIGLLRPLLPDFSAGRHGCAGTNPLRVRQVLRGDLRMPCRYRSHFPIGPVGRRGPFG